MSDSDIKQELPFVRRQTIANRPHFCRRLPSLQTWPVSLPNVFFASPADSSKGTCTVTAKYLASTQCNVRNSFYLKVQDDTLCTRAVLDNRYGSGQSQSTFTFLKYHRLPLGNFAHKSHARISENKSFCLIKVNENCSLKTEPRSRRRKSTKPIQSRQKKLCY